MTSARKAATARKIPALRRAAPQAAPQRRIGDSIAIIAIAASIAAAGLLVDPRAESAFEAPKRLAALIAIVAAALAVLTLPRLTSPTQ